MNKNSFAMLSIDYCNVCYSFSPIVKIVSLVLATSNTRVHQTEEREADLVLSRVKLIRGRRDRRLVLWGSKIKCICKILENLFVRTKVTSS